MAQKKKVNGRRRAPGGRGERSEKARPKRSDKLRPNKRAKKVLRRIGGRPMSGEICARSGVPFTDRDAQLVDQELAMMEAEGVAPVPENLWRRARDPECPIHHLWNWDVRRAAEVHWLEHARRLIAIVVTLRITDGYERREWLPVRLKIDSAPARRRYVRRAIVLEDDDALRQLSRGMYQRVLAEVKAAEDLGLCARDLAWASIYREVTSSVPFAIIAARDALARKNKNKKKSATRKRRRKGA